MSNTEITQGVGSTDGDAIVTDGMAGTQSGGPSGGSGMDIVTGGLGSTDEITQGYGALSGADTTAPSIPSVTSAAVTVAQVTITLTLTPGSDVDNATNTLTYNIYRDGVKVATGVAGPTWSETKAADGTSHSYGASMSDPAGNEGPVYTLGANVAWSAPAGTGSGGGDPFALPYVPAGGYAAGTWGAFVLAQFAALRAALPVCFVSDVVDDPGASSAAFKGGADLSAVDNFYLGQFLAFTGTASLAPQAQEITGYVGVTREFTFATPFVGSPVSGDAFIIVGKGATM